MLKRIRPRLSYANVMSSIAVFAVLGGGAYAQSRIGTNDIQNRAITKQKLAKGAVGTAKVERRAIGTGKIKPTAVGIGKMKDGSVGPDQLLNGAVGELQLQDAAVTTSKLDPGIAGVALAGVSVNLSGNVTSWFNRFGDQPLVVRESTGRYVTTFPGLDLNVNDFVHQATATSATFVRSPRVQNVAGAAVRVNFRNHNNDFVNTNFSYMVYGATPVP